MYFITVILKNLLRRKLRNALTVIGIGIGIGAVVSLVSITDGFMKSFTQMLKSRGTDIAVTKAKNPDVLLNSIDESLGDELKKIEGVEAVSRVLVDLVTIEDLPSVMIFGFDPDEFIFEHFKVIEGRKLKRDEEGCVMIGKILAKNLNLKTGDKVEIEREIFNVVGIYESGNVVENGGIVMNLKTLQRLMNREGYVTVFNIKLQDLEFTDSVIKEIKTKFPNLEAMTSEDITRNNEGYKMAKALAWATSLIALFVGALGTMNTVFMSVFERTKEFGLLRAIGWRRRRIMLMILGESIILGIIGGIVGMVIGVIGVHIINQIPIVKGAIVGDFSVPLFLKATAIAIGMGIFGGVIPSSWGSSISPAEALRYE